MDPIMLIFWVLLVGMVLVFVLFGDGRPPRR